MTPYIPAIITGLFTLFGIFLTWKLGSLMNAQKKAISDAEELRKRIEIKTEEDHRKLVQVVNEIEANCVEIERESAEDSRETIQRIHEMDKGKVDWVSFQDSIKRLHFRMDKMLVAISWLITKQGGNPSEMELTN